jgi:hypothetical protein
MLKNTQKQNYYRREEKIYFYVNRPRAKGNSSLFIHDLRGPVTTGMEEMQNLHLTPI